MNQCGCRPETCASLGLDCGCAPDRCGGIVSCPTQCPTFAGTAVYTWDGVACDRTGPPGRSYTLPFVDAQLTTRLEGTETTVTPYQTTMSGRFPTMRFALVTNSLGFIGPSITSWSGGSNGFFDTFYLTTSVDVNGHLTGTITSTYQPGCEVYRLDMRRR